MTRILFSDGEAIEHADFNLQREIFLRQLFDDLAMNMAGPDQVPWASNTGFARQTEELRPLRHAGAFVGAFAGTSVSIKGGLWIHVDFGGVLSQDAPLAEVANKSAVEVLAGFVAAAAGTYRRDIIQARITDTDDATVARDVEDAITREVTTQNPVKRSRLAVEYQRKAGVQQASQALADDPANEAVADVGWFKIGSVLVDQVGLMDESTAWDWRKPWGYSKALTHNSELYWDSLTYPTFVRAGGGDFVTGDTGALLANCPLARLHAGCDAYGEWAPYRLEQVLLVSNFVSAPAAGDVLIRTMGMIASTAAQWGSDLGTLVGTGHREDTLVDPSQSIPPLWSNGGTNPNPTGRDWAQIHISTAADTDRIYGVQWRAWGGY